MSSAYQPNIPTGLVNLDQDYLNIQGNFQQLDTSFGVNHVPFSVDSLDNPAGYHTEINFVPFSTTVTNPPNNYPPTTPAATAGFGQLFSCSVDDGLNSDTSLYFLTGGNRLMQLTRNIAPVAGDNGYTYLPGGIIVQWGRISSAPTSSFATLLFNTANINFPNDCFNVWTQPYGSGTPPGGTTGTATVDIRRSTISATGFEWVFISPSSQYIGFSWIAIGN